MEAAYELEGLQFWYGRRCILDIPSLVIQRGETLGLIGPNGAGKTTLLQILALLRPPTAGALYMQGQRIDFRANLIPLRRQIALVFQEALLLDGSVFENVAVGLKIRGVQGRTLNSQVERWLVRLGIRHLASRPARSLSGGEQHRVSLARALVTDPSILLLDEPFEALDPPARKAFLEDLEHILLEEVQVTALVVTHEPSEALRLASRLAVMEEGRIQQLGTPDEVCHRPASTAVAQFLGMHTLLPGRVTATLGRGVGGEQVGVEVAPGKVVVILPAGSPLPLGAEVVLCISPGGVELLREPAGGRHGEAPNQFAAMVTKVIPLGFHYQVLLDCGFPLTGLVSRQMASELGLKVGSGVVATFQPAAVHVIPKGH